MQFLQNSTFHNTYHPLNEVQSFLKQLTVAFPNITRLASFGLTAEGRQMMGLTISSGVYDNRKRRHSYDEVADELKKKKKKTRPPLRESEKLGIVILGAQHAREVRFIILQAEGSFNLSL
jgi:hypothetical protein